MPDPTKPKSKAQRDKERAEARLAAKVKEEERLKAKKDEEEKKKAEAEAADKQIANAAKAAAEAKLKFESDLARAAIGVKSMQVERAMSQLVSMCESAEHACGGLLVLLQNKSAAALLPLLLSAVLQHKRMPGGGEAPSASTPDAEWVALLLTAWAMPLGWLVVRCDGLAVGQRALLDALEGCAASSTDVLREISPVLKGLWEANVLGDDAIATWHRDAPLGASGKVLEGRRRARKFADALVQWLDSAKVVEEGGVDATVEEVA